MHTLRQGDKIFTLHCDRFKTYKVVSVLDDNTYRCMNINDETDVQELEYNEIETNELYVLQQVKSVIENNIKYYQKRMDVINNRLNELS